MKHYYRAIVPLLLLVIATLFARSIAQDDLIPLPTNESTADLEFTPMFITETPTADTPVFSFTPTQTPTLIGPEAPLIDPTGAANLDVIEAEPTWTPSPMPTVGYIPPDPTRNLNYVYRIIEGGDVAALRQAIVETRTNPDPFVILLKPGTYIFTDCIGQTSQGCVHWSAVESIAIGRSVIIRGVQGDGNTPAIPGQVVLQRASTARFAFSFFFVEGNINGKANLTLYDLTLNQGGVYSSLNTPPRRQHGGAIFNFGVVNLYRVILSENWANKFGGAIMNWNGGVVQLAQTTFFRNRTTDRGYGAAIYNQQGGTVTILPTATDRTYCNRFEANGASRGGTLTLEGGVIYNDIGAFFNLRYSQFINNGAIRWGGIYNRPENPDYPVNRSFWSPLYTSDMLRSALNASFNVTFGQQNPSGTVNTPLNCPVPAPPPPPPLSQDIYKINVISDGSRQWSSAEQIAINTGVSNVGRAFDYLAMTVNSPQAAFNLAMLENSGTEILFIRTQQTGVASVSINNYQYQHGSRAGQSANFTYPGIPQGSCFTFQESVTSTLIRPAAVVCNGALTDQYSGTIPILEASEYTIVHELGHLFDYRTLYGLSGPIDNGVFLLTDCSGASVMIGAFTRGRRGWGTGPQQYYNFAQTPVPLITDFQQNPEDTAIETAADSFLNWVYRLNSSGGANATDTCLLTPLPTHNHWSGLGYLNREWSATPASGFVADSRGLVGTPDARLPGDRRYLDFDRRVRSIFVQRGW